MNVIELLNAGPSLKNQSRRLAPEKNNKSQIRYFKLKILLNQAFMVALISIFVHHHLSGFVVFLEINSCRVTVKRCLSAFTIRPAAGI